VSDGVYKWPRKQIFVKSLFVVMLRWFRVVNCINSTSFVATLDHIIQDCKILMAAMSTVNVLFVNCSLNSAAHSLVGLSKTVASRTWLGHLPTQSNSTCNAVFSAFIV
jgi:hypothetical protein